MNEIKIGITHDWKHTSFGQPSTTTVEVHTLECKNCRVVLRTIKGLSGSIISINGKVCEKSEVDEKLMSCNERKIKKLLE